MAPSFGRSISFPLQAPTRSSKAARHVRSISLPCRSHPLLGHLRTHIDAVRVWASQPASASAGLAHIAALHAALADLLDLPEAQDAARSSDRLLDALLVLADAYGTFQETLLALKADVADVQAALRRRDAARLASAARSQRRNDKDLARLVASLLASSSSKTTAKMMVGGLENKETEMTLMDAAAASAAASAALFSTVASISSSSSKKTAAPFAAAFAKKETTAVDEEKIQELEQCIHHCETGSDMVFRSIVRTRVSLLNIRTPAI